MTAEEHILMYIESSAPRYARLLQLEKSRKHVEITNWLRQRQGSYHAREAFSIVQDTYTEMLAQGAASNDGLYSGAELLRCAVNLLEWEAPE